ncbi:hypothetical protein F4810DRAFT_665957 [Camillea tinctor]|nr:hypothetical protein F4810DRAFT_665957 [Camillea tinctor]
MISLLVLLFATVLVQHHVIALQVTPGSTCAALCLDNPESDPLDPASSNTRSSDIVCSDEDYDSVSTGIKYKNCLDCLQKSNATSGTESDTAWFLYNVRYSVDVCLFGFPNVSQEISSPCDIDYGCAPLKKALETGILNSTAGQYEYCTADGGRFTATQLDSCVQCFASSSNQEYMANFIIALQAGCQQKPQPGTLLGLSGSLFTSSLVNITDPPVQQTSDDNKDDSGVMTTGAIAGIAIGAALLFIGGTALFWVYHRKQKRLYGAPIGSDYDPRNGCQSITPPLIGASYTRENKPLPAMSEYELRAQRAYADNPQYHDALEKEIQLRRPNYAYDPSNPGTGPGGALPTHFAYVPQAHSRQASGDSVFWANQPVRTNKPDSYAMEIYLNSVADATAALPRTPPQAATARGPSPLRNPSPPRSTQMSTMGIQAPQISQAPQAPQVSEVSSMPLLNIPPPPPPPPQVPSLSLPSVPRIRIPKKYSPPNIVVGRGVPVDNALGLQHQEHQPAQGSLATGVDISQPIVSHEPRFGEGSWERRKKEPPPPLIIPQVAQDRRSPRWVVEDAGANTGTSGMYG